ncbi:uncharacterized protein [Amphiura filiformis]|uniref:uncharacterized protein n=1 Tax=Amphiura filiformis TaxID=82378 RepID=UPI003B214BA4
MASLFKGGRKAAQLELNSELPHFDVYYIGRSTARAKMGRECTKGIVEELIQKAKLLPELQRVSVTITSKGIMVREMSETNPRETFIPIYDVTYGAADKSHKNVFSFVTNFSLNQNRDERKSTYDTARPFVCHAFYCRDAAMARAMVVYLVRAFKVGFESWKRAAKSQELREKIRAGPGQGSSTAGETIKKSSSSGSGGTLKQLDINGINNLSPRITVPPKVQAPPVETSNHVDKVTKWLDKWLNVGDKKPTSSSPSKSQMINTTDEENQEFSKRMQEFSDPDTLNIDIDIKSELEDPEVRSVLEEMAEQTEKDENESTASAASDSQETGSNNSSNSSAPTVVKPKPKLTPVGMLQNNKQLLF